MSVLRTNAAMLGVSPNTLRSWERRFEEAEAERVLICDASMPHDIDALHAQALERACGGSASARSCWPPRPTPAACCASCGRSGHALSS